MEEHFLTAHALQSGDRVFDRTRFAKNLRAQGGDLIAADDEIARPQLRDITRLGERQPFGEMFGGFVGPSGFVDLRSRCLERQPEAFEQLATIDRGRGENEVGQGGRGYG